MDSIETNFSNENQKDDSFKEEQNARRQSVFRIFIIIGCIILLMLYCFMLDLIVLANSKVPPFTVKISHSLSDPSEAGYGMFVDWEDKQRIHPELSLGKDRIIPSNKVNPLEIELGKEYKIQIAIPADCDEGTHLGVLIIEKSFGDELLPINHSIDLSIDVEGSVFKNFMFSKYLMMIFIFILIVVYIFMILLFPKPYGRIIIENPLKAGISKKAIRLKMSRLAIVFPWRRSTLKIGAVLRKNKIRNSLRYIESEIRFRQKSLPPFLIVKSSNAGYISRLLPDQWNQNHFHPDAGVRVKRSDIMYNNRSYCYYSHSHEDVVLFRFDSKR